MVVLWKLGNVLLVRKSQKCVEVPFLVINDSVELFSKFESYLTCEILFLLVPFPALSLRRFSIFKFSGLFLNFNENFQLVVQPFSSIQSCSVKVLAMNVPQLMR